MTRKDIYDILDAYAPFSLQESYDKSGLLVGDPKKEVHCILLTLDITTPVVTEAAARGADLIISHHPVIWDPLRSISPDHPVWHLVQHDIGAICSHTCLDIAEGGLNDYIGQMLEEELITEDAPQPLSFLSGGRTLGRVAELSEPWNAEDLLTKLDEIFGCNSLRYYAGKNADNIKKIAWCTGSGGDLLTDAAAAGADALITGDCKHSVWAEAHNLGITLFDCGHFETEAPVVSLLAEIIADSAPDLKLLVSEPGTQPFFKTYQK